MRATRDPDTATPESAPYTGDNSVESKDKGKIEGERAEMCHKFTGEQSAISRQLSAQKGRNRGIGEPENREVKTYFSHSPFSRFSVSPLPKLTADC